MHTFLNRRSNTAFVLTLLVGLTACERSGLYRSLGDYQGCEPRHTSSINQLLAFGYNGQTKSSGTAVEAEIDVLAGGTLVVFDKSSPPAAIDLAPGRYDLLVAWDGNDVDARIRPFGATTPTWIDIRIESSTESPNEGPNKFSVIDTPRKYGPNVKFKGIQVHRDKLSAHFIPLTLK